MRLLGILPLILLLGGCSTTNFNDVQVARYEALGKIESNKLILLAEVEKQKTEQIKAASSAPQGGMSITLDDGQVLTYTNPNAFFSGGVMGNVVTNSTPNSLQATALPQPVYTPSKAESALKFIGGFLESSINPLATVWSTKYTMDAQVAMRQSDNERFLGEASFDYQRDSDMFTAFSGFGDNMENTALGAIDGNVRLGQSFASEMKQMANKSYEAFHGMNGQNQETLQTAFENPLTNTLIQTNSESSTYSSEYEEIIPEWFGQPTTTP